MFRYVFLILIDFTGKNKGFEKQEKDQITEHLQTNGFGRDLKIKKHRESFALFYSMFFCFLYLYWFVYGFIRIVIIPYPRNPPKM